MNLLMASMNKEFEIVRIREKSREKESYERHLVNLGFIEGAKITVISENMGNLIIKVKDSRVAIGRDIAKNIIIR